MQQEIEAAAEHQVPGDSDRGEHDPKKIEGEPGEDV
jgi:hypothetical protein